MSLYSDKTLLDEEIESWKGFLWALREPDKKICEWMIEAAKQYADAIQHSGRTFTTDSFFMALIFAQHRMIQELQKEIQSIKRAEQQTLH